MAGSISLRIPRASVRPPAARFVREPAWVRWPLVGVAVLFMGLFLLLPLLAVCASALADGWQKYVNALTDDDSLAAIRLTLLTAVIAVPLNVVFGVAAAWCIAKFEFAGKSVLTTLIDLPYAISPVVAGLIYVLLLAPRGLLGPWLEARGIHIIFAVPGVVIATVFVTFPFVAREMIPLMQSQGTEEEQAARVLGAGGWQIFRRVTLPNVKWGLLYGVILCNARAMGEFGAVSVVSNHLRGLTNTMPLQIEAMYNDSPNELLGPSAPFAVASLLAMLAIVTLVVKSVMEWKTAESSPAADELIREARHEH
jgi:sulfate transport system permease protein